jgi:hypothetical protein
MPVTPTYPGVYIEEVPSGVRTITGVATSITAFVGYTARGPVNQAVRIFNFGDYERNFGGLSRSSEISYAVQQFFQNGGGDAYVVRVAQGAAKARVNLQDLGGGVVLTVEAASEGVWGNNIRVVVDYATSNPDSTFNLTVTRYELVNGAFAAVETEQFRNLSMNSGAAGYAVDVAKSSRLIRLTRAGGLVFGNGYALSGIDLNAAYPALTASQTTLVGVLDGDTPFTLVLQSTPANLGALVTALNSVSIPAAGLGGRIEARRADILGVDNVAGDFLKLVSLTAADDSAVTISRAAANDVSQALGLGVVNGGREVDGSAARRPAPNGTLSGDLADILSDAAAGDITTVTITDQATGTALFNGAPPSIALPGGTTVMTAAGAIQTIIRAISHPAAQNATVQLVGTRILVRSSATAPAATIALAGTGAAAVLLDAANDTVNVHEYQLGTALSFGAQVLVVGGSGSDGSVPTGVDFLGSYDAKTGIYALRNVDLFNLLVIPATTTLAAGEAASVIAAAASFCEERRAFFVLDVDPREAQTNVPTWAASASTSRNVGVFYPQILVADPLEQFRERAMSSVGAAAGVFARTDANRGVWKAPAGTEANLNGVRGLSVVLTDMENGPLNQVGVNALRSFPNFGFVVWGARTRRGADALADEYKYIPVRRLALFLEESLYRGTQWVVFEPNDEPLWAQIRLNLNAFMQDLFQQGAFAGKSPREAFFVKCDRETTTPNDINLGIVNIVVGFAPLKPAEFVIIKIQQISNLAPA